MDLPQSVALILSRLEGAGYQAYLVGGCVRDYFMGKAPHDFDITTNALPHETVGLFSDLRVEETGLQHGTVTVFIDHLPIEITTFRTEGEYSDHRHPDGVEFTASVEEDLARRDFTMNAIAYSLGGRVVDPFGGRADIEAGVIRCVGDGKLRFSEDALRILRALRFAARFGFSLEPSTDSTLFACAPLLKEIAVERVLEELKGILTAPYAGEVLSAYEPVLKELLPELFADCAVLKELPPRVSLRFAGWLWKMGREKADRLLKNLKASNQLRREVGMLTEGQNCSYPHYPQQVLLRPGLSKMKKDLFCDHLLLQLRTGLITEETYTISVHLAVGMVHQGVCLSIKELAVGGKELMELGLRGAEIGKMQQLLFRQVMEERLPNERHALLEFAKNQEK